MEDDVRLRDERAPTGDATAAPRQRTGHSVIEHQAVARIRLDVASMPASDVVQLALWPDTIANWARSVHVSTSVVYNMLSRVKPYRRVRELLAHRVDVPVFVLDHLVDAARPLPIALRPPDPDQGAVRVPPARGAPAADTAALLLPGVRDGSNPLERRAVFRVETEIAALPASLVVQLALYPETLAAWARREGLPAPMLYSTLAGAQPHQRIRHSLARRLGTSPRDLDALIGAMRPEPQATRPPTLPDVGAAPHTDDVARPGGAEDGGEPPGDEGPRSRAPSGDRQLPLL
jgi:hypothetical protein